MLWLLQVYLGDVMALNDNSVTMAMKEDLPITNESPLAEISTSSQHNDSGDADSDDLQFVDSLDVEPESPTDSRLKSDDMPVPVTINPDHKAASITTKMDNHLVPVSQECNNLKTESGISPAIDIHSTKQESAYSMHTDAPWYNHSQHGNEAMRGLDTKSKFVNEASGTSLSINDVLPAGNDNNIAQSHAINCGAQSANSGTGITAAGELKTDCLNELHVNESSKSDQTRPPVGTGSLSVTERELPDKPYVHDDIKAAVMADKNTPSRQLSAEEKKVEMIDGVNKIIKHFIEGFVIEESTEPFPVCIWIFALRT